ncbi:hypothetical protein O4J56_06540 [Nocardiopsis sp. RSe5-2]|uniref:Uncharacterized protein n=1 Tax=Nocardiopsis endophytica TaxID=3018445 RepID=A0ABT4U040_9ACTN|nr:hypothetical protein [Nocardiopsis endophytica]MDA2810292.1 hypothetical protein [Nocardiopsis endophytica]
MATRTTSTRPVFDPRTLRAQLEQFAPDRLAQFDEGRSQAEAKSRAHTDPEPLRAFVEGWAVEMEIVKRAEWREQMRRLSERRANPASGTLEEARQIAAEVSRIRTEAACAAGVLRKRA